MLTLQIFADYLFAAVENNELAKTIHFENLLAHGFCRTMAALVPVLPLHQTNTDYFPAYFQSYQELPSALTGFPQLSRSRISALIPSPEMIARGYNRALNDTAIGIRFSAPMHRHVYRRTLNGSGNGWWWNGIISGNLCLYSVCTDSRIQNVFNRITDTTRNGQMENLHDIVKCHLVIRLSPEMQTTKRL